jgi:hypothetical protein
MNYDMSPVDQGVSYFSSPALYATLEYGSNGDPYGDPTYTEGDDQGEENWGFNVWDSDISDGINTGAVPVQFTGLSNGNESLSVGTGATPLTYSGDSFGTIASVQVQAAVQIPASVQWSSLSFNFYTGSTLEESDVFSAGPSVNTINTPNSPTAEQILTVIPTSQSCNKVVVTGTLQMTAPAGTYPGPTDMFSNIAINSN